MKVQIKQNPKGQIHQRRKKQVPEIQRRVVVPVVIP